MKHTAVKILTLLIISASDLPAQYTYEDETIYFGAGTSVASYVGGYFGQAYLLRAFTTYDYYYDYYDDYSGLYYYGDYYNNYYTLWSPLVLDLSAGYKINDFTSFEVSSSLVWHYNGRVDPQFETGNLGRIDYLDRNDPSSLFAIPVSLMLKLHSGPGLDGVYIKGGPAFQYVSESYDRVREFYDFDYYGSYTYSIAFLKHFEKKKWMPGFTVGMGLGYSMGFGSSAYTELEYSYFNNPGRNNSTALALDRAPESQLISFKTKVYFSF